MAETIDAGKEAATATPDKGAAAGVEAKVSTEVKDTKSKIEGLLPPEEAPKPAEKTKSAGKPKSADTSASRRVISSEEAASANGNEPKNFTRNATIGMLGGTAALATLSPSFLAQLPLIGKIPYLPQAAAALQSGISSMITPLGLGTGTQATNSFMSSLPLIGTLPTGVGTALTGAALIPAGLWSIGMAKSLITGEKYGLGTGNIKEAARTIVGLPFKTYDAIIDARNAAGRAVHKTWDIAKTPFAGAWNLAGKIAKSTWNAAAATTSAALTPTKWGIGGLLLGVALSGGSAAAIPMTAGLGYGIMNYLKNTGAMDGKNGASK